jgi:hypothetical protein
LPKEAFSRKRTAEVKLINLRHAHQPWGTALAMQAGLHLVSISQTSLQFTDRAVYDERYEGPD